MSGKQRDDHGWGAIAPGRVGDADPAATIEIPPECITAPIFQQPIELGEIVSVTSRTRDPRVVRGPHPSGIASWVSNMMVEIKACAVCHESFPRQALDEAHEIEGETDRCGRCRWANGLPPLDTVARAAMEQLRWRLNEYRKYRERDRAKEHQAFVDFTDACYHSAPILLRFLEGLYGDQVLTAVDHVLSEETTHG